jgi:hypothetical protein
LRGRVIKSPNNSCVFTLKAKDIGVNKTLSIEVVIGDKDGIPIACSQPQKNRHQIKVACCHDKALLDKIVDLGNMLSKRSPTGNARTKYPTYGGMWALGHRLLNQLYVTISPGMCVGEAETKESLLLL